MTSGSSDDSANSDLVRINSFLKLVSSDIIPIVMSSVVQCLTTHF